MEGKKAIEGDYAKELLCNNGFTPNPEPYASPFELQENETHMWTDVNAGAVRRGDEVPDYPIRIVFKKRKGPMGDAGIEFDKIRELTAEEARSSKALGRGDQEKVSPWPSKKQ